MGRGQKKPSQAKPAAPAKPSPPASELGRRSADSPAKSNGNASKDSTGRLLAAAGLLDAEIAQSDASDSGDTVKHETPTAAPEPSQDDIPSIYPEMSATDTGATGMLKLEDLDAQFAESAFGDDTGMFNVTDAIRDKLKKAAGKDE